MLLIGSDDIRALELLRSAADVAHAANHRPRSSEAPQSAGLDDRHAADAGAATPYVAAKPAEFAAAERLLTGQRTLERPAVSW